MSVLHLDDLRIGRGDALVIIDVQVDFLPGGALAVPGGETVIAPLNRAIDRFRVAGLPVFATRDWHPLDHLSFREHGGPWPPHCVQGTPGARFAAALDLPPDIEVVSAGFRPDLPGYSGFEQTDLAARLRAAGVHHLFVGGLATDYCVLETVLAALDERFAVSLLVDAVRALNVQPDDGLRAIDRMQRRGAVLVEARARPLPLTDAPHLPP